MFTVLKDCLLGNLYELYQRQSFKKWGEDNTNSTLKKGRVMNLLGQHKDHGDHGLSALSLSYHELQYVASSAQV